MPKTRKKTYHYLLGQPAPLPANRFPSKGEVVNYVKLQAEREGVPTRRSPPTSVYHTVADEVRQLWEDEGIPIYDKKKVVRLIRAEYDAVRKSSKISAAARGAQRALASRFGELFDIAICKCKTQKSCNCPRHVKVPSEEWSFLQDQRRSRDLSLGSLDRTTTSMRNASLQRRNARLRRLEAPSG